MKNIFYAFFLVGFLIACSQDDENPGFQNNEEPDTEIPMPVAESVISGDFVSGAHTTTGMAAVNTGNTSLNFNDFKTDDGPKLLVYLTTEVGSEDFVSLGDLKGISGDFTYVIPANTDLVKYHIVDIWCIDFSVSFGHADLK